MKNLCLVLLALLPTLAAAEPSFNCEEKGTEMPYVVNFSNPIRSAGLRKQVAGGFRNLALLACVYNAIKPEIVGPQPYLTCAENEEDHKRGYSLVLYSNTNPTKGDVFLDGQAKAAVLCDRR